MMINVVEAMKEVAVEVKAEFSEFVKVSCEENSGEVEFSILMKPKSPEAASIYWSTIAGTFTVSVSPRLEWRSEEWIKYEGDDDIDVERGVEWSRELIWRIIRFGAFYARLGSPFLFFMRPTQVAVGDEFFDRPYERLESWEPWC